MFKKFKDKLAEEMKQSPARLQASMQQLAQAVPGITNISTSELSTSNDNFSLTDGDDDTPRNTPDKYKLQAVDLTSYSSNSMGLSRTSSINSVTSTEISGLFPIYESPSSTYHLQSDMDQSASEVDENVNPQFDQVSKEQIYTAYRKVQTKYHKYRGRYTDLANYYREMERAKSKLESLLVETQDKALRRIADLKEQCQLEQQAKAHLEEALRNDIEEKDHIIDTLYTKVKLLQVNATPTVIPLHNQENLIDIVDNNDKASRYSTELFGNIPSEQQCISESVNSPIQSQLIEENQQLKNKSEKLENLIVKYKESLKRCKDKISEVTQDKLILERDLDREKHSNHEQLHRLTERLNEAEAEIMKSKEKINTMKRVEEESAISLAENKLSIHRELEIKEEHIKKLTSELKSAMEGRDNVPIVADNNSQMNDTDEGSSEGMTENKSDDSKTKSVTQIHIDPDKYLIQEETIKSLNDIIEAYVLEINEAEKKIQAQNTEMIQFSKESEDNYEKLRLEFENKHRDFLTVESELINCRSTLTQLNDELGEKSHMNDHLITEKNNLIKHIVTCMTTVRSLKYNCKELKSTFINSRIDQKQGFSQITQSIQKTLLNYQLNSNSTSLNDVIESYENELQARNTEIMNIRTKLCDVETRNSKLIAELDNVNCKIFDITKERDRAKDYVGEISKKKDSLDAKFREVESKYLNQLHAIQTMTREIDTMRQTYVKQEEMINQYNDEKLYLSKKAEQVLILEENCKKLNEEIAEKTTMFENKISALESENEIYKNNITEHSIQLKHAMDNYELIEELYEKSKSDANHKGTLLEEELLKSQSLIAENVKHCDQKSVLNIKIRDLIDMVQTKNEFIEKLKLFKVKSAKIIKNKDSEIENLLAAKTMMENVQKFTENEWFQLNHNYSKRIDRLTEENAELINANMELYSKNNECKDLAERLTNLANTNDRLQSELDRQREITVNLEGQIQDCENLTKIIEELGNYKEKSEIEIKELKNVVNELSKANQELQDGKSLLEERVDELQESLQVHKNEITHLKNEIVNKNVEIDELCKQITNDSEVEENRLQRVVEELQSQLQERESMLITSQAAQTKIENLNDEFRNEAEKLREQLATFEAEQALRMQQLVKEFQARLHDKDIELQAALDKKFDWQKNYESELVQQYREQLKDFQLELTAKSEEIQDLKVEKNTDTNKEIEKLVETIANIKMQHANELKEADVKWREALKSECDQLEAKHNVLVNELTNEWKKNKFTDENVVQTPEELGNMSAMAMAAVKSNTGSFHSLQQTLVNQRRELFELRKLVKIRHETLDDSTEIEYLRNILYEYMMGKETLVLARVIAAVVKFDQEQTNKILKKEEDKLTLLGSLGLN